jgi:hypothetical protein
VAFATGWLVAETWQGPRYSPWTDTISDLQAATAPHVWFPIACFAIGGVSGLGFAVFGLRSAWAGAAPSAPWRIGLSCLALGNSFPLLPCQVSAAGCTATAQLLSPGGLTDAILSSAALWVLATTPLSLARRLRSLPEWMGLSVALLVAGVAATAAYALLAVSVFSGVLEGLAERVLIGLCQLWVGGLAVALIRSSTARPWRPIAGRTGNLPRS